MLKIITLSFLLLVSVFTSAQEATVYFDLDKYFLTDSAKTVLVKLSRSIKNKNNLVIHCHCDSSGSIPYNQVLSNNRAATVKTFLGKIGQYNFSQAEIKGYGKLKPKFNNKSEDRFKNRRCDVYLKKDFIQNQTSISASEPEKNSLENLALTKDVTVSLPKLEYVGNQAVPNWYSMKVLQDLHEIMVTHPDLEIELLGHVCCDRNKSLSVARAKTVFDYLVANGIDPNRMSYQGFSNTQPLVPEISEENEQRNRRVEVKIVNTPTQKNLVKVEAIQMVSIDLIDIYFTKYEVPLRGISFYNLQLMANMISQSSGYYYVFRVYEKDGDLSLSGKRRNFVEYILTKKRCKKNQFKVLAQGQDENGKGDYMRVEIIKR